MGRQICSGGDGSGDVVDQSSRGVSGQVAGKLPRQETMQQACQSALDKDQRSGNFYYLGQHYGLR
jgi:hypothetical protein